MNDTIITRFPFSLKACQAPRDRRGRWEDVCEMKSPLCRDKSGQRRALNHSDTTTKRRHFPEKSHRSHQTSSGEGAGGLERPRADLQSQAAVNVSARSCFTTASAASPSPSRGFKIHRNSLILLHFSGIMLCNDSVGPDCNMSSSTGWTGTKFYTFMAPRS